VQPSLTDTDKVVYPHCCCRWPPSRAACRVLVRRRRRDGTEV